MYLLFLSDGKTYTQMYTLNLCVPLHHFIQHWTQLKQSGRGPWPEERSAHAACCLNYGQQYPQLLVHGGLILNRHNRPLEDVWILDVERGNWRKVKILYQMGMYCKFGMPPNYLKVTIFAVLKFD